MRELKPEGLDRTTEVVRPGEKTTYEITVVTADEPNAGTRQDALVVLIGENGQETRPKMIENRPGESVLRRGHSDLIRLATKSVGELRKVVLAHVGRMDDVPRTKEERRAAWLCKEVVVKDLATDTTWIFPVMEALLRDAEPKAFRVGGKREGLVNKSRLLSEVKYEVSIVTGNDKSAGTSRFYCLFFC